MWAKQFKLSRGVLRAVSWGYKCLKNRNNHPRVYKSMKHLTNLCLATQILEVGQDVDGNSLNLRNSMRVFIKLL